MEAFTQFELSDLTPEQIDALVAGAVGIGTLYCFLGHRMLRLIIGITGFLIAGAVAAGLIAFITGGHVISTAVAGALGGACGAMALSFLYRAGIFVLGFLGASLVAYNATGTFQGEWLPFAILGVGVLGGLIALLIEQPVMILATAAIGSWLALLGLAYFLTGSAWAESTEVPVELEGNELWILGAWAGLALLGAVTQWSLRKRAPAKKA